MGGRARDHDLLRDECDQDGSWPTASSHWSDSVATTRHTVATEVVAPAPIFSLLQRIVATA